jgi:hypothetical protein
MGGNARIHAASFDAEPGALIATFPEGQTANTMTAGHAGGALILDFKEALGVVAIEMRGENGGTGAPGMKPDEALAGKAFPLPGLGTFGCDKGKKGYPGSVGYDGGNTGTLELHYASLENHFHAEVKRFVGAGGEGGAGGDGGAPVQECLGRPDAAKNYGPQGDSGPSGAKGLEQPYCIFTSDGNSDCVN